MSIVEAVVEGTLQADGTLLLDRAPALRPGRVRVVLMRQAELEIPQHDAFWQRMQAIWDAQNAFGHVPRTVEQIESEQRAMRAGWEARQAEIERVQQETRGDSPSPLNAKV